METKAFLALVISYVLYLVVGAAVFYEMERYDAGDHCGEAARFFSELNATNNHTFEAVAAAIEVSVSPAALSCYTGVARGRLLCFL